MTTSAMGKKRAVLGLAVFLVLSGFTCQVSGSDDSELPGLAKTSPMTPIVDQIENENENESGSLGGSSTVASSSEISREERSLSEFESEKSVTSQGGSSSHESGGAVSNQDLGKRSIIEDEINRLTEGLGHFGDGTHMGQGESENRKDLFTGLNLNVNSGSRDAAATAQRLDEQKEFTKSESNVKTRETESKAFTESHTESSKQSNSGARVVGSLGIGQTGMWRCINQDRNGVREDDDSPIVIPKYNLDDIIQEESSYEGSSTKTSSLIKSLTQIVEKHRKGRGSSSSVIFRDLTSVEKAETINQIKVELQEFRSLKVTELVTRSDFEQILMKASRYEELTSASVSYIARLSKYKRILTEGNKASMRVESAHKHSMVLSKVASEKQSKVDAELALVKTYAKKGDALYVKIFAMKKALLELEAEKKKVEMTFQKIVANLSIVIEEAAHAYEEHHVAIREWREEKTSLEISYEARESAESVWVSFLSTL